MSIYVSHVSLPLLVVSLRSCGCLVFLSLRCTSDHSCCCSRLCLRHGLLISRPWKKIHRDQYCSKFNLSTIAPVGEGLNFNEQTITVNKMYLICRLQFHSNPTTKLSKYVGRPFTPRPRVIQTQHLVSSQNLRLPNL